MHACLAGVWHGRGEDGGIVGVVSVMLICKHVWWFQDPTTSMLHVIWHLFVLAGSAAHWWAIYAHVLLPVDHAA